MNNIQMTNSIPSAEMSQNPMLAEDAYAGKRFARKFTSQLSESVLNKFHELTIPQLRAIIKVANQFSETNCGWSEYWMKEITIRLAKEVIEHRKTVKRQIRKGVFS